MPIPCVFQSFRNASTGSIAAALLAGYNPAAIPLKIKVPIASAADHGTSLGGSQPGILPVSSACFAWHTEHASVKPARLTA